MATVAGSIQRAADACTTRGREQHGEQRGEATRRAAAREHARRAEDEDAAPLEEITEAAAEHEQPGPRGSRLAFNTHCTDCEPTVNCRMISGRVSGTAV